MAVSLFPGILMHLLIYLAVNHARAMRIAELMQDHKNIHAYISALPLCTAPECANQEGCIVLRQCVSEAYQLLSQPYGGTRSHPNGDLEREKGQLRQ